MDRPVTAVVSTLLSDELGITFSKSQDGWRFHSWHLTTLGAPPLPPPVTADCERCFATAEQALAYFQVRYGTGPVPNP